MSWSRVAAWLVHVYTAAGAIVALVILNAIVAGDYRAAFLWMVAATIIDATDGTFARLARVKEQLPWFRGDRLDDIVDYTTYVLLPAYLMLHAGRLPRDWGLVCAAAVLMASAFGFSSERAKTADGFFTGFPSYWNIVAFYVYASEMPAAAAGGLLLFLSANVFVPIRYVYPSRTVALRGVTLTMTVAWAALMVALILELPHRHPSLLTLSLIYPMYYAALSIVLMVTPARRE